MIFSQFSSMSVGKKIAIFAVIGVFLLAPVVLYSFSQKKPPVPEIVDQQPPKPTLMPFPSEGISQSSIIIRYKEGKTPDELQGTERYEEILALYDQLGVKSQEKIEDYSPDLPDVSYSITFGDGVNVEEAAKAIYELPEIEHAEPNAIIELYD